MSGEIPHLEEEEEKENEERWLLTYADMITLLVAFFMMLYSMSILNLERFKEVAIAIRSGFGGTLDGKKGNSIIGNEKTVGVLPIQLKKEYQGGKNKETITLFMKVKKQIIDLKITKKLQGILDVKERKGNLYIVILTDKIFFKPGDATLTDEAKSILKEIGKILFPLKNEISVEGYTSKKIPESSKYRNSWELSAARAISVIDFFIKESNILPQRLSLTGYGEWRPYFKSVEKNDRVVIAVLKKTFKGGNKNARRK